MHTARLQDLPLSDDPTTALAHCPAVTAGLPITVLPIPGEADLAKDLYSLPRLFVAQQGSGRRWYQLGARTRPLRTAPRMIEIYEGGLTFDHCHWQGDAGRSVLVQFADADVQALTHGELQRLNLHTQHELFDDRISGIVLQLAEEALHGMPNGRLYGQGLCVALIGVLDGRAHAQRAAPQAGRLGRAQCKRVTDLIHDELGSDLSLKRLADEAGLSPHHFVRVFKATFGTTPHRYVQQRRIAAAAAALQQPGRLSIAEIAIGHGFASQAHMTALMRRHLGATPGAIKRDDA